MPVEEQVLDLVAKYSGADRRLAAGLAVDELPRWGSLPALQLVGAVERDLGIVADLRQVLEAESVAAIVEFVCSGGGPS